MTRIKMYIFNVKLPFYPLCKVKCGLQNKVSTPSPCKVLLFEPRVCMLILAFTFDVGKYCNEKKKVSDMLVAEKIMGFVGFRLFRSIGC